MFEKDGEPLIERAEDDRHIEISFNGSREEQLAQFRGMYARKSRLAALDDMPLLD